MAIVAASGNGAAPSTAANRNNNGGTVLQGGNVDTTGFITNNFTMQEATAGNAAEDIYGSTIVAKSGTGASTTDRVGVRKAVNAGTIAFTPTATQWIMKGGNVSTTIGGVANTVLVGGHTDFDGKAATRDNIQENLATYMLGSGNGTFDVMAVSSTELTPGYTKGGDAGSKRFFVAPSGAGDVNATDDAAVPTRAVPGELTYMDGSPNPVTDEYQARDSANSV